MVLVGCGAVVGCGWVGINRYGAKLVEIKTSVNDSQQQMPFKTTICHGLLQIVTVALGSPLGREVAPLEISAAFATKLSQLCHVDERTHKLLVACASGAGLAAVYNVPLASAVFTLETLLVDWSFSSLGAAMLCCGTAV
ncbi:MAG: chloride channel protein [Veillonellales bacterium]